LVTAAATSFALVLVAALTLWTFAGVSGHAGTTPEAIVIRHARSALAAEFDTASAGDRAALLALREASRHAHTRAELLAAWNAIPNLRSRGPTFLEQQVFERAVRDDDWPAKGPPISEKAAFVDAVGAAIAAFLGERGREERR
jgi:hypothetical protein